MIGASPGMLATLRQRSRHMDQRLVAMDPGARVEGSRCASLRRDALSNLISLSNRSVWGRRDAGASTAFQLP